MKIYDRKSSVKSTPPRADSSKNRRSSPARGSTIQSVRDVDMLDLLRMLQRNVNEYVIIWLFFLVRDDPSLRPLEGTPRGVPDLAYSPATSHI
jgi:hypothetical protein